ncbi:hypothetical protein GIB67_041803 [Kingdonia uniflora]|uniref:GYF domain-containing protein n=1 Tax=Kingdonia uniflora TaxID=39325 RepID=A0A7J7L5S8_9MAGN|nr:hypothetical protein GIB67_041803 [Kingdonia uniflora]
MSETKLNLPEDLSSSSKEESLRRHGEENVVTVFLDEPKDQLTPENSIPLSPQWLYAKPAETKTGLSSMLGDARAPNSVPHGNSIDSIQKDGWRLDGSQEKKDWRRVAPEIESSRRWREEERETGTLGRRDRRKEDRHDVTNRNSIHETSRDNKWTSRWGPEDKEKDSRTEKRSETNKDDTHIDKQPFAGNTRAAPVRDVDSRDKWRPRHRLEVHSSGSSVHRVAPGFGLERGRVDSSSMGFASGRGRSSIVGSPSLGRCPSGGPIGAVPADKFRLLGKSFLSLERFCYPRGKLLDIYRKQKNIPSFAIVPDELEEEVSITQSSSVQPLAFVTPDAEETTVLNDMWKGKITSSGALYNTSRDKMTRSSESLKDLDDAAVTESKSVLPSRKNEENSESFELAVRNDARKVNGTDELDTYASQMNTLNESDTFFEVSNKVHAQVSKMEQSEAFTVVSGNDIHSSENIQLDASRDVKSNLPVESSIFDSSAVKEDFTNNGVANLLEMDTSTEELNLYYRDPQGEIQGPFVGYDIIKWLDEGYFGIDLPVCLSDAPVGTPFQKLGEVLPYLKRKAQFASATNPASVVEPFDIAGGSLDDDTPTPAPDFSKLTSIIDQHRASSEFEGLSAHHFQSEASNCEDLVQPNNFETQRFHEFIEQYEDVAFHGKHGGGNPIGKPSGDLHEQMKNSSNHSSVANELAETTMLNHKDDKVHPFGLMLSEIEDKRFQSSNLANLKNYSSLANELEQTNMQNHTDNKLHPFGLMWSEIEDRRIPSSNMDPIVGRDTMYPIHKQTSFGSDAPLVGDTWSDSYRRNTPPISSLPQNSIDFHHFSRLEQEREMRKLQAAQNSALYLKDHLDHRHPIHHQQSVNQMLPDSEYILELQLQRQRQAQVQQYRLQQQQEQQLHQRQMQLQQQQQSQAQQLLEQLLQQQMLDPRVNHNIRANNMLDQVLLRQQRLHEFQQHSNPPPRHPDPFLDQLIQAKFGQNLQQEQNTDLLELLSRANHGQMASMEQALHQEQLLARQLSLASRQQLRMEEERRLRIEEERRSRIEEERRSRMEEERRFRMEEERRSRIEEEMRSRMEEMRTGGLWSADALHHAQSAGVSPLEFFQQQQRPYDIPNALAHVQGLDMHERNGPVGSFSSGIHSHHLQVPSQFHASHPEPIESNWSATNARLGNSWEEARVLQLQFESERQKRESDLTMSSEDLHSWVPGGGNDGSSNKAVMDLRHHKLGIHTTMSSNEAPTSLHQRTKSRESSWNFPGSSPSDHQYNLFSDQHTGLNNKDRLTNLRLNEEHSSSLDSNENLFRRSHSGVLVEEGRAFSGLDEAAQFAYGDSNVTNMSSLDRALAEEKEKEKRHGSQIKVATIMAVSEVKENSYEPAEIGAIDHMEVPANTPSRHTSLGNMGVIYNYEKGLDNTFGEDLTKDRASILSRDSSLLKRPPVSRVLSSQAALSELASAPATKAKNSIQVAPSSESGRDSGANTATQEKDTRYRRTSSCSDADVLDTSFIAMLKKPAISEAEFNGSSESSEAALGNRSGKKKGKKGRHIDPALLGFKVTSNRIMMGEIQRLDE